MNFQPTPFPYWSRSSTDLGDPFDRYRFGSSTVTGNSLLDVIPFPSAASRRCTAALHIVKSADIGFRYIELFNRPNRGQQPISPWDFNCECSLRDWRACCFTQNVKFAPIETTYFRSLNFVETSCDDTPQTFQLRSRF